MQVRFARSSSDLSKVEAFYNQVLGMERLGRFEGHKGWDGVMLGYESAAWHLEFTKRAECTFAIGVDPEELLVLYVSDSELAQLMCRINEHDVRPIHLDNPYWVEHGAIGIADPDGHVIVLFPESRERIGASAR